MKEFSRIFIKQKVERGVEGVSSLQLTDMRKSNCFIDHKSATDNYELLGTLYCFRYCTFLHGLTHMYII